MLLALAPVPRAAPQRARARQLRGAPGQAGVSLVAIVASVSLMVSMAIMVASFRDLARRLARARASGRCLLCAPTLRGDSAYLAADDQARICRAPRRSPCRVPARAAAAARSFAAAVVLLARDLPATRPSARPAAGRRVAQLCARGDPPPVWVSEAVADLYGLRRQVASSFRSPESRELHRRRRLARLRAAAGRRRHRARDATSR